MRRNSSCEEIVQISSIDKDFFLVFQLRKGPLPSVVVLYSYFVNYLSNDSATLLLILSLITGCNISISLKLYPVTLSG